MGLKFMASQMNCPIAAFPVQRIVRTANLGSASMASGDLIPRWFRQMQVFLIVPKLLRLIDSELTNDKLATLSEDQVKELAGPIHALYLSVSAGLDAYRKRRFTGTLFRLRIRAMDRETERLGDIAEALMWSADAELREFIRKSAGGVQDAIEREHASARLSA
jgi:hypothetical protein